MPSPDAAKPEHIHKSASDILTEIREEIIKNTKSVTKKPTGWSRQSVSPYYREKFALELKAVLDAMIKDNEDRIYYYEKFAKLPFRFSPATLYSYVYQASRYLRTEDITGVDREFYTKLLDRISTTREPGVGVRLSFHTDIPAAYVDIAPELIKKKSTIDSIKEKITEWIDKAEVNDRFEMNKLGLTPQEISELEESFSGTDGFLAMSITTRYIKIQKTA